MLLRAGTLFVWALAAASAAFWGLKLFVAPPPVPAHAQVAAATPGAHADFGRLLGADAPPVVAAAAAPSDSRYHLLGVVSPRSAAAAREGLALIVVDDKPARAIRVGADVDDSHVLQSVNPRGATLGPRDGAAAVALTLPPPTSTSAAPPARANGFARPPVPRRFTPTAAPAVHLPIPRRALPASVDPPASGPNADDADADADR
jgi:general secretion pathway protein C